MSDHSDSGADSDDALLRTLTLPNENADNATLHKVVFRSTEGQSNIQRCLQALKTAQQAAANLVIRNRQMQTRLDELESKLPNRRGKKNRQNTLVGENVDGYLDSIVNLAKRFAIMEAPWVPSRAFGPQVDPPAASPAQIFSGNGPDYIDYLTARLYASTPQQFHKLLDAKTFEAFSKNVRKSSQVFFPLRLIFRSSFYISIAPSAHLPLTP